MIKAIGRGGNYSDQESLASLRQFLGAKYLLYVSSGQAALWVILKALSQLKTDRRGVVIPVYTCPAVA
jgi:dTDP-4-amino-4,6-dideoxygalactose transaminase